MVSLKSHLRKSIASNIHFRLQISHQQCKYHHQSANCLFMFSFFCVLSDLHNKKTIQTDTIVWKSIKMSSKTFSPYWCARFATVTLNFSLSIASFHCAIQSSFCFWIMESNSCISQTKRMFCLEKSTISLLMLIFFYNFVWTSSHLFNQIVSHSNICARFITQFFFC